MSTTPTLPPIPSKYRLNYDKASEQVAKNFASNQDYGKTSDGYKATLNYDVNNNNNNKQ
jgi:hypothetical protein